MDLKIYGITCTSNTNSANIVTKLFHNVSVNISAYCREYCKWDSQNFSVRARLKPSFNFRQKNKSPMNQVYYNITAYEWFHGKREDVDDVEQVEQTVRLRNVSMEDAYLHKSHVQDAYEQKNDTSPVIMKIIPSRGPKTPKVRFRDLHTTPRYNTNKCSQDS